MISRRAAALGGLARAAPRAAPRRAAHTGAAGATLDASTLRGRHLDNFFLHTPAELRVLLDISHALKKKLRANPACYRPLVRGWLVALGWARTTRGGSERAQAQAQAQGQRGPPPRRALRSVAAC